MSSTPPISSLLPIRSLWTSSTAPITRSYSRVAIRSSWGIDILLLAQLIGMGEGRLSLISSPDPVIHWLKLVTTASNLLLISPLEDGAYMW